MDLCCLSGGGGGYGGRRGLGRGYGGKVFVFLMFV